MSSDESDGDWDDWTEGASMSVQGLFTDETFNSVQECLVNAAEHHGFDLYGIRDSLGQIQLL